MIQFLDNQVPSENWSRFLIDLKTIDWSKISLAGHSQGSAHTMYISKRVSLFQASFYSGPNGFELNDGNFPNWISQVGATDISKIYAFSNSNDNLYPWNYASDVWDEIGILGSKIDVDVSSDFSGSNRFTTSVIPPDTNGSFSPTHGSTTVDIVTPIKSDGRPLFENVWKIMSFPD